MKKLPVRLSTGETIRLSPSAHSEFIKAIIEEFAPRFVPGGADQRIDCLVCRRELEPGFNPLRSAPTRESNCLLW